MERSRTERYFAHFYLQELAPIPVHGLVVEK